MTSSPWATTIPPLLSEQILNERRATEDKQALFQAAATLEIWLDHAFDNHFNDFFHFVKKDEESAHYPDLYLFHHGDKVRFAANQAMGMARDLCLGINDTDTKKTIQNIAGTFGGMNEGKLNLLCEKITAHKGDYSTAQAFPTPHLDHEYILCTYLEIYIALHDTAVESECYSAVEEKLSRKHPAAVINVIEQLEKGTDLKYIFAPQQTKAPTPYVDMAFDSLDAAIKCQLLALENHASQNPFALAADPKSLHSYCIAQTFLTDMLDGLWNIKARNLWQNVFEHGAANMVEELSHIPQSRNDDFTPPEMNEMYGIAGFVMRFYHDAVHSDPEIYTKDITNTLTPVLQQTINTAHLFAKQAYANPKPATARKPTFS